ncbi:MAG: hypothetical protein R3B47_04800 [Bacteroidia bacterium]
MIRSLLTCFFILSITGLFGNPIAAIGAKKVGDDVHISWRLADKAPACDFIVERSLNNKQFEAISIITNTGKRLSSHSFGYVDENVVAYDTDQIYYRVVAIIANGENIPSEVVSVSQKESRGLIIDYFRLPEQPDRLFVAYRANGSGDLYLQVFGPSGHSLFYKKIERGPGFQVVEVPINPEAPGKYRLQLFDDRYAVEKEIVVN